MPRRENSGTRLPSYELLSKVLAMSGTEVDCGATRKWVRRGAGHVAVSGVHVRSVD